MPKSAIPTSPLLVGMPRSLQHHSRAGGGAAPVDLSLVQEKGGPRKPSSEHTLEPEGGPSPPQSWTATWAVSIHLTIHIPPASREEVTVIWGTSGLLLLFQADRMWFLFPEQMQR